jgi:ketosteroid isomerase-like protein
MKGKKQRIRALEDKDAIRELTARYCFAVARNDVDAVIELFCKDGALIMNDRSFVGHEGLREGYGGAMPDPSPKPFIQNHVIELDGDRAHGICAVEIRAVQDGEAYTAAGWYQDEYRREMGEWKFASRRFEVYHWVPLRQGWAASGPTSPPLRAR